MRLIDADMFCSHMRDQYVDKGKVTHEHNRVINLAISIAKNPQMCPTVDAEPVRHGRWIGRPLCGNDDCRCSNCGYWENVHANIRGEITQKYCPNCGARMGMEEEA